MPVHHMELEKIDFEHIFLFMIFKLYFNSSESYYVYNR